MHFAVDRFEGPATEHDHQRPKLHHRGQPNGFPARARARRHAARAAHGRQGDRIGRFHRALLPARRPLRHRGGAARDNLAAMVCERRGRADEARERLRHDHRRGLSIEAILALRLAAQQPERVHGVACFAPTLWYDGSTIPKHQFLLRWLWFLPPAKRYRFAEREPFGIKDERMRAFVIKSMAGGDTGVAGHPSTHALSLYQFWMLADDIKPKLKDIKRPVFIAHPREDDLASLKNAFYSGTAGRARGDAGARRQLSHHHHRPAVEDPRRSHHPICARDRAAPSAQRACRGWDPRHRRGMMPPTWRSKHGFSAALPRSMRPPGTSAFRAKPRTMPITRPARADRTLP